LLLSTPAAATMARCAHLAISRSAVASPEAPAFPAAHNSRGVAWGLLSVLCRIAASDLGREASLAHDMALVRRPPKSVEDRHRVEVVAPPPDLAIRDSEHRDVPVGVGRSGQNDPTVAGVLEHDDAGVGVVMDSQIVAPVQDDRVAVRAVYVCDGPAALDVPRSREW
jgi:hypothetical protein